MHTRLAEVLSVLAALLTFACGAAGEAMGESSHGSRGDWRKNTTLAHAEGLGGNSFSSSEGSQDLTAMPAPLEPADWHSKGFRELPPAIITEPGELPYMQVVVSDPTRSTERTRLPLRHTHVSARLSGFVAEVEVSQTYENPHRKPIEVVYIFPLPENSAVNHMHMQLGKRRIEAQIKERGAARRTYERAKRAGHTAALLDQERPNVFTQSVANIAPGEKVDVVLRYVQDLSYDSGWYEFVFPMVVGPRYMPGAPLEGPAAGEGTHSDTHRVPDASRVSPPYVGKGERSGHDISLELAATSGGPITRFRTPTHQVVARQPADGSLRLSLAEADSIPNRDFVLRYHAAGEKPRAALFTGSDAERGESGFFSLVLHPPELDVESLVGRREISFVVDISGSMTGLPLALCRSAMRYALARLRPTDTFNVITFESGTQRVFDKPRPANRTNVRHALQVVDQMQAGGGTEMANAIEAALNRTVAKGRHRYVFFLTDGYIGNESEIIGAAGELVSALAEQRQRARVFGFGPGPSVNRHLLEGLAKAGHGVSIYVTNREDPQQAVNQFFHYIDRAVVTNVKIDWGGLAVSEVTPSRVPDLFASHPVILHGRYRGKPARPIVVSATLGERGLEIPVSLRPLERPTQTKNVLGVLWARAKIDALEDNFWDGTEIYATRAVIRDLGLQFSLVTPFTSFVAVDNGRVVGTGAPGTIVQPVEQPEGVDVAMVGGMEVKQQRQRAEAHEERRLLEADEQAEAAYEDQPSAMRDTAADSAAEPIRRGCGCRIGATQPGGDAAWLSLLALLRRRRRG